MVAAWMIWSVGVGLVFALAGLALEKVLTLYRKPTRWVWLTGAAATLLVPLLRLMTPVRTTATPVGEPAVVTIDPLAVTVTQESALRSLDEVLLLAWVALSSLLIVTAFMAGARLLRRRRGWRRGRLNGEEVSWSDDMGPAVVGLFRPEIVLPAWARDISSGDQSLILAHEGEHIRGRDPQLRFVLGALVLLFPWNVALWFQFHRLGLAMELDCDRRVMRRMPDQRRAYGDLLLQVGAFKGGLEGLAVAALSEEPSLLERRIRDLVWRAPQTRTAQAGVLAVVAVVAACGALVAPGIVSESAEDEEAGAAMSPSSWSDERIAAAPTFTPFTVAPDILNRAEVQSALDTEYPPLLREAGIGGTTKVWFFIDAQGLVQTALVNTTSGHGPLDEAALRVAEVFRFSPARNRDDPVPVWVALDITFNPNDGEGSGRARATGENSGEGRGDGGSRESVAPTAPPVLPPETSGPRDMNELREGPAFTRFTTAPDITNRSEVQSALVGEYPPLLRDAGIGGTIKVWFLLDEEGVVQQTRVNSTSGHEPLDAAALRVAEVFRFTPALEDGKAVPVWIALDITFTTGDAEGR